VVKRYNLSSVFGDHPKEGASDAQRKVAGGPKYPLDDIQKLLDANMLNLWTRECQSDVRELDLDLPGVASLIEDAIQRGRFKNSEWCEQKTDGPWALCDVYVLTRKEWNQHAHKELDCSYYLKFAISKTGTLLLVVSCHT
jgi:hypothetical protein